MKIDHVNDQVTVVTGTFEELVAVWSSTLTTPGVWIIFDIVSSPPLA